MSCPFKVGDKVIHPRYKEGVVIYMPHEKESKLTVGFKDLSGTIYYTHFINPESSGLYAKWNELELLPTDTKKVPVPIGFNIEQTMKCTITKGDRVWHEEFGEGTVTGDVWSTSQNCWIAVDVVFDVDKSPYGFKAVRFHFFQQEEPNEHHIDELELADERAINFHKDKKETTMSTYCFKLDALVFHPKYSWGTVTDVRKDMVLVSFNPQEESVAFYDGTKWTSPGLRLITELSLEPQEKKNMVPDFTKANEADQKLMEDIDDAFRKVSQEDTPMMSKLREFIKQKYTTPDFTKANEASASKIKETIYKASETTDTNYTFKKGDRVRHNTFGEGTVAGIECFKNGPAEGSVKVVYAEFDCLTTYSDYIKFYALPQDSTHHYYIKELELIDKKTDKSLKKEVDELSKMSLEGAPMLQALTLKELLKNNPNKFWEYLAENPMTPEILKIMDEVEAEMDGSGVEISEGMALQTEVDVINKPAHYTATKIEPIDVIETWGLGFHLGNTVKYIARHGKKDPKKEIEDLKKARWYLDRYIESLEKKD